MACKILAEEEHNVLAKGVLDSQVCSIPRTNHQTAVHCKLKRKGSACLLTRESQLIVEVQCWDIMVLFGAVMRRQINDPQEFICLLIVCQMHRELIDKLK